MRNALLVLLTIAEGALPFLRSVLLARLLSPDDFGVTVALAIALTLPEMIFDIGLDAQSVKSNVEGKARTTLPTLQLLAILRATLGVILLAVIAPLFFAGMEQAVTPLVMTLLLASVWLRGFGNLGFKALMANGDHLPDAAILVLVQFTWTTSCVIWAVIDPTPLAVAAGMLIATVLQVSIGASLGPYPLRFGFDRYIALEAFRFGLPLLLNGALVAVVAQGDRLIVGASLGAASLALISVVLTLSTTPRAIIQKLLNNILLPHFMRSRDDPEKYAEISTLWLMLLSTTAALFSAGFICFGAVISRKLFGSVYDLAPALVVFVGLSAYCRFMFGLLIPIALSKGRTDYMLRQTLVSLCSLIAGLAALVFQPSLESFVLGAFVGDLIILIFVLYSAVQIFGYRAQRILFAVVGSLTLLVCVAITSLRLENTLGNALSVFLILGILVLALFYGLLKRSGLDVSDFFTLLPHRMTSQTAEECAGSGKNEQDK